MNYEQKRVLLADLHLEFARVLIKHGFTPDLYDRDTILVDIGGKETRVIRFEIGVIEERINSYSVCPDFFPEEWNE